MVLEQDLKPVFSQWVRKIDPLLQMEDTNCLFEAFRRKREVYGRGKSLLPKRLGAPMIGAAIGFAFVTLVTLGILRGGEAVVVGLFVMMVGAIGVFVVMMLFTINKGAAMSLPSHTSGIIGERTVSSPQVIFDIYMSGVTGREIANAIYLEARRGALASGILTVVVVVGIQCLVYIIGCSVDFKNFSFVLTLLFMAVMAWMTREFVYSIQHGLMAQAAALPAGRAQRHKLFMNFEPLAERLKKEALKAVWQVPLGIAMLVVGFSVLGAVIGGFAVSYDFLKLNHANRFTSFLFIHFFLLIYLIPVTVFLTAQTLTRSFFRKRVLKKIEKLLATTGDTFEMLLRVHASGIDPEMKEFAYALYKQREEARKLAETGPPLAPPPPVAYTQTK